jgi:hypothetical protein
MFGWDSALELIGDALCDVGDDLIEQLAEELVSGDFAASPALVRLGEILREHKQTFENPEIPTLREIHFAESDEALEKLMDNLHRVEDMQEAVK